MTLGDADTPDSIARALFDALQDKRAGNKLPLLTIPLARIRATQLQHCLSIAKEHSDCMSQVTLGLIAREHEALGPANLADKVPTVRHTLECTTSETSTTVPAQGKQQ